MGNIDTHHRPQKRGNPWKSHYGYVSPDRWTIWKSVRNNPEVA